MESSSGYLKRAWHDLTAQEKWWQPVAILSLVDFIPVVGGLFTNGYLLDWAREGAWGMDRGLPRKVGDAGKRLKWGFFSVIIALCWILPVSIVANLFAAIPIIGWLFALVGDVAVLALGIIAMAASVRMAIYDNIKGGLQFSRLFKMAQQDPYGLVRCFGINMLSLIPVFVGSFFIAIAFAPTLAGIAMSSNSFEASGALAAAIVGTGLMGCLVALVIMVVIVFFVTICNALAYRAIGYWIGQFQPAKWGGIEEPMPFEPGYAQRVATASASAAASNPASEPEPAEPTSFSDVAGQASAAAAAAGTFVKEHAQSAADKAGAAASGFKTEHVEAAGEEPEVIEAEVVSVDDVVVEQPAAEPVVEAAAETEAAAEPEPEPVAAADPEPAEPTQGEKWAAIYREAYAKAHGEAETEPAAEPEPAAELEPEAPAESEPQQPQSSAPNFCPQCGTKADSEHKFCVNCGNQLQ